MSTELAVQPKGNSSVAKILRVLVVEDSEEDTLMLLHELKKGGYKAVHERVDAAEGMAAALGSRSWDLIIADYALPHFSGLNALKILKESGLDLPFILVSGKIGEEQAVEAMKAGVHDYIMKGSLKRLVPVIERELNEAQIRNERHQTEAALRQSEEKYRQIFQNAVEGIFQCTPDGQLLNVNPALAQMFGYESAEAALKANRDLAGCYFQPGGWQTLKAILAEQGQVREFEAQVCRQDQENFWVSINARTVQDPDNNTLYCEGTMVNITRRKQAEAELKETNGQLQAMVQEFEQRNREANLINRMSEALQSCLYAEEAYGVIARFAQEFFPEQSGALFILPPDKNLMEIVTIWGQSLATEEVFPPEDCWAVRRGRFHFSGREMACRHLPDKGASSLFCLPLIAQGETLGVLHLEGPAESSALLADDLLPRLAGSLTSHISLSVANLRLRETLRFQAIHDPLTGLFNRRYLEETLKREISRVMRKKLPLGVIMMDLDRFKEFNDAYGHEVGDDFLRVLGNLLKNKVRQGDIACRYGGEEFVLVMPEASLEVTRQRAEEIRARAPSLHVPHQGLLLEGTTISLGVAVFPDHGHTGEEVLRAADKALYRAKAEGRNQAVVAEANA